MRTSMLLFVPALLVAQSSGVHPMDRLAQMKGNKILLLGSWSKADRGLWDGALEDEALFTADFSVQEVASRDEFEGWLRREYGVGAARWLALDTQNRLLSSGTKVPAPEALESALATSGFVNPLRQLRQFLKSHPDHLEARADLLVQLRRRALKVAQGSTGDLNAEQDTLAWAPFADAVDAAFQGSWRGLSLPFFRVEEGQPEARSPIMRFVFGRHIAKVEGALMQAPTNESLWNLWAWMARSLGHRSWSKLNATLEPFLYPGGPTSPAPNVAAWLVREAKAKGDWAEVEKLARTATGFQGYPENEAMRWFPGGMTWSGAMAPVKGYPLESAWQPLLEALLHLRRDGEAMDAFNELCVRYGERGAAAARAAAMAAQRPEMAKLWNSVSLPKDYFCQPFTWGIPALVVRGGRSDIPGKSFYAVANGVNPTLAFLFLQGDMGKSVKWPSTTNQWAVIDGQGRLLALGDALPTVAEVQTVLDQAGVESRGKTARAFLRTHPDHPDASGALAIELGKVAAKTQSGDGLLDAKTDAELWGPCAEAWANYFKDEYAWGASRKIIEIFEGRNDAAARSPRMKALAERQLPATEAELRRRPMSMYLWSQWLWLRKLNENRRTFPEVLEDLKPSPTVTPGAFPPALIMQTWFDEARKAGQWREVIEMLKPVWARELHRVDAERKTGKAPDPGVGNVALLLTEALLQNDQPSEADQVMTSWGQRGGRFASMDSLLALAKARGYETLAKNWKDAFSK
ncbi:MAG: hypothetical protein LWX11_08010 [Firmicutes bacterium]|nr:hypothetical protein [Bacillota bacterium]